MTSTRPKLDTSKGGRKAQTLSDPGTPSATANTVDAEMLHTMMASPKNDIFEKIDAVSAGLHMKIHSVRDYKQSIMKENASAACPY